MSDLQYATYEDLIELWNKRGKDRLHMRSSARAGFKHKPIGEMHGMCVLHTKINLCRSFLQSMSISECG